MDMVLGSPRVVDVRVLSGARGCSRGRLIGRGFAIEGPSWPPCVRAEARPTLATSAIAVVWGRWGYRRRPERKSCEDAMSAYGNVGPCVVGRAVRSRAGVTVDVGDRVAKLPLGEIGEDHCSHRGKQKVSGCVSREPHRTESNF